MCNCLLIHKQAKDNSNESFKRWNRNKDEEGGRHNPELGVGRGTNFDRANFDRANIDRTNIDRTNFDRTHFGRTHFGRT